MPPSQRYLPCSERVGPQLTSTMETMRAFEWLLDHGSDDDKLAELLPECPLCFTRDEVYLVDEDLIHGDGPVYVCRDEDAVFLGDLLDEGLDPYIMDEARDALREGSDLYDWAIERSESYLLSVDTETEVHLQFSWGGPSDGMYVTVDADGSVTGGRYYFKDWFDGATRGLDSYDLATIERVYASTIEWASHKEDC
jgi:hypothetical protein